MCSVGFKTRRCGFRSIRWWTCSSGTSRSFPGTSRMFFLMGELSAEATVAKSATVQTEGGKQVTREIEFYNLDVIISVGYRVKSKRGTQFRIWATQRLREYIVKGFTMDDERLKNPPGKGHIDYFDELLERIRDIRSSERQRIWRRLPRRRDVSEAPTVRTMPAQGNALGLN